jgi:hypothetical protein
MEPQGATAKRWGDVVHGAVALPSPPWGHTSSSALAHGDGEYVERLKRHLEKAGLTVWTDSGINYGGRWPAVIATQIDDCAAFVAVMSPRPRESEWVQREILYAQENKKPILPLLLEGKRFIELINVQDDPVTNGELPSTGFIDRLRALAGASAPSPHGGDKAERPKPQRERPSPGPPHAAQAEQTSAGQRRSRRVAAKSRFDATGYRPLPAVTPAESFRSYKELPIGGPMWLVAR